MFSYFVLLTSALCSLSGINGADCPQPSPNQPFCNKEDHVTPIDIFYVCSYQRKAYDVNQAYTEIQAIFDQTLNAKRQHGLMEVWINEKLELKRELLGLNNETLKKETITQKDVSQALTLVHGYVKKIPNIRFVVVVIESVSTTCLELEPCKRMVNLLRSEGAYVFVITIFGSNSELSLHDSMHIVYNKSLYRTKFDHMHLFYKDAANCLCKHLSMATSMTTSTVRPTSSTTTKLLQTATTTPEPPPPPQTMKPIASNTTYPTKKLPVTTTTERSVFIPAELSNVPSIKQPDQLKADNRRKSSMLHLSLILVAFGVTVLGFCFLAAIILYFRKNPSRTRKSQKKILDKSSKRNSNKSDKSSKGRSTNMSTDKSTETVAAKPSPAHMPSGLYEVFGNKKSPAGVKKSVKKIKANVDKPKGDGKTRKTYDYLLLSPAGVKKSVKKIKAIADKPDGKTRKNGDGKTRKMDDYLLLSDRKQLKSAKKKKS